MCDWQYQNHIKMVVPLFWTTQPCACSETWPRFQLVDRGEQFCSQSSLRMPYATGVRQMIWLLLLIGDCGLQKPPVLVPRVTAFTVYQTIISAKMTTHTATTAALNAAANRQQPCIRSSCYFCCNRPPQLSLTRRLLLLLALLMIR